MKAPLAMSAPLVRDVILHCADGLQLAAQVYTTTAAPNSMPSSDSPPPRHRILCLHGWMDNCRSFHHLAPALLPSLPPTTELVALDLPGHGWSSHRSADAPPVLLADAVVYVAEAVRQLQWWDGTTTTVAAAEGSSAVPQLQPFTLVGHSMGAAISCLYAAAFPEQIEKLVLLEGAGPLARPAQDCAQHVRQSVLKRQPSGSTKPPRIYPSLSQAVAVRMQTAQKFPGRQYLSETAATELVVRGTRPVPDTDETDPETPRGWQFRHDPRLQWPSLHYFTPEQVDAIYQGIQCPVALLLAHDGWPFDAERHARTLELLRPTVAQTLPGSHHFHADPDTADAVVAAVAQFLRDAPQVAAP